MTLAESLEYLRRYQQWRTQADHLTMEQAGLSPKQTTAALAAVLTYVPQLQKNHLSTCSKLRKCQVQRTTYNLQLRRDLKSSRTADLRSAPEPPPSLDGAL